MEDIMVRDMTTAEINEYFARKRRESAAWRSKWLFRIGFPVVFIGIVLAALAGVHNDFHRIVTVPAGSLGTLMFVGGLIALAFAVFYEFQSRD